MAELLLEVLSEEIPSRMQANGAAQLKDAVLQLLKGAGVEWSRAEAFWTPRRLAVLVDGLPVERPDKREERRGPRTDAPEKAVQGFLTSVGLQREELEIRTTKKGEFFFAVVESKGGLIGDFLSAALPDALAAVSWPKSMRWGEHSVRWVRPIHSILCLFDGAGVPFSFGPVASGTTTRGHRFHAPAEFPVRDYGDYRTKLRDSRVMLDASEREACIAAADGLDAAQEGLSVVEDPGLLEEVAGLVEWPVVLTGRFDAAFLDVPEEILLSSMRGHQKYFALRDRDGKLAPRFICVANIEAPDAGRSIIGGNERVLRARLSDAKFFWDQDRRRSLASRVPQLGEIIFHAKLGTLDQKTDRVEALSLAVADRLDGAGLDSVRAAARLAKADLVTQVVGEFPELQGTMGRYYAMADGEPPEVADAIAEHYLPRGPSDAVPFHPVAVAVALADKLDTLVGFFAIGETPTGSKDPFALRRAALGVIRIVLENDLDIPLRGLIATAAEGYGPTIGGSFDPGQLLDFVRDRLRVHLRDRGMRHDVIAAAFSVASEDNPRRLKLRVDALTSFLATEDGANLLAAHKRAANIVRIESKNDSREYSGPAAIESFADDTERTLATQLGLASASSAEALKNRDFVGAMETLAALRAPVDAFFDQVTVNVDDVEVRENRLRLLSQMCETLNEVADFSQIEG